MSGKEIETNLNLIRNIFNYSFDEDEVEAAGTEGQQAGLLGWDFFPDEYEFLTDPKKRQLFRDWYREFEKKFERWHQERPWFPRLSKGYDRYARAFYYNPKVRRFIETLDEPSGTELIGKLPGLYGPILQKLITVPDHPDKIFDDFNGKPVLTNFSLAYMRYLLSDKYDSKKVEKSIPYLKGDASMQFWTVAPYLYHGLRKKDLEEDVAIDAVLEWGMSRTCPSHFDESEGNADFPGMTNLRNVTSFTSSGWYLSGNPEGESHTLARKVGAHIADQIAPIYQIQILDLE